MNLFIRLIALVWISMPVIAQTNNKPNVVIIYADDLGYGDLSCYGGDIPTPHIDQLAESGIRFTDFYVAAPVCTPSRFALLTGIYPHRSVHGLTKALMPLDTNYLDPTETTLAAYLKNEGYRTALIGKWHLGAQHESDLPTGHGFDTFTGLMGGCVDYYTHSYGKLGRDWYRNGMPAQDKGYSTDLITDYVLSYLEQANDVEAPFFLYIPYNAPHYGKSDADSLPDQTIILQEARYDGQEIANTLQAPAAFFNRFPDMQNVYRRMYAAMVSNLDDNVGKLMKKLKEEGLAENTMVWFISDNGGSSESLHAHASNGQLRGEKGTLREGGIRVPALVSWKGAIKAGQVVRTPVCNTDIVPTITALAGIRQRTLHKAVDGVNITDLLLGNAIPPRDIFWIFRKQTAIRSGKWKLLNGKELYDLEADRSEKYDLSAKYPRKVQELRKRSREIEASGIK